MYMFDKKFVFLFVSIYLHLGNVPSVKGISNYESTEILSKDDYFAEGIPRIRISFPEWLLMNLA